MVAPRPVLTLGDAERIVADHGFLAPNPAPPGPSLGIEIEWHTVDLDDPRRTAPFAVTEAAARGVQLPGRSRLTFEPGGQVELSSRPLPGFDAVATILTDARVLTRALARAGVGLLGIGLLPGATRPRTLRSPRYDAMEAHFDSLGSAGRTMMRQTAAIQVNVDLGENGSAPGRWRTAHALGPMLAAAFANSPFSGDTPSGWCSTRLEVWLSIERGRGDPVASDGVAEDAWADYSLRAPLMLIRASEQEFVPVREPLSFADWIRNGHALGWPTEDDLAYHLTTLFPPIRPRGWLELRMVDSLPTAWSVTPAIVTAALLEDPEATARIAPVLGPIEGRWEDAARCGLHDPDFARAAHECFDAALDALPRLGVDRAVVDVVDAYRDRYVHRERCPADDLLDHWHATGRLVPGPEPVPAPTG
jgi:glutamate--cysteine ligase